MKTIKCKWCGKETLMLNTKECDHCWELRQGIEYDIDLARKILASLEKEHSPERNRKERQLTKSKEREL